jgi:hypothetical protein
MIKAIPGEITNQIIFVPRTFPTSTIKATMKKSNGLLRNEEDIIEDVDYLRVNNKLQVIIPAYTVAEGDSVSIAIHEGEEVIYRGLITCTEQDTQEYSSTASRYTY